MQQLQDKLHELLHEHIRVPRRDEHCVQLVVYVGGRVAVDLAVGPCDRRSLFNSWSVTKAFVATAVHLLVERGQLEYDAAVADSWPDFAAQGKHAITVRDVLTHRAGLSSLPADVNERLLCDWQQMTESLATARPCWSPGSETGYHFWTFGWIAGELVRRVDGRPIGRYVAEEICRPLGIDDFFLGIPAENTARVIPLRESEPRTSGSELYLRAAPPEITTAEFMNRAVVQQACIPGCGGIMNAHAIARHFALLANFGELDGVRLFKKDRVERMRELQTDAEDIILGKRYRKALGYFLGGAAEHGGDPRIGDRGLEFGHAGYSRALGFADPERGMAFGLTKNVMNPGTDRADSVAFRAAELIRAEIDG